MSEGKCGIDLILLLSSFPPFFIFSFLRLKRVCFFFRLLEINSNFHSLKFSHSQNNFLKLKLLTNLLKRKLLTNLLKRRGECVRGPKNAKNINFPLLKSKFHQILTFWVRRAPKCFFPSYPTQFHLWLFDSIIFRY